MKNRKSPWFKGNFEPFRFSNGIYQYQEGWELIEPSPFTWSRWSHSACILGREHYTEFERSYPFQNAYHLYKVIRAEASALSSQGGKTLWQIVQYKPGDWKVLYWSISPAVLEHLQFMFRFIVPESMLLSVSLKEDGIYELGPPESPLYVCRDGDSFNSAKKGPLINSLERFKGIVSHSPLVGKAKVIGPEEYDALLVNSLKQLPIWSFVGLRVSGLASKKTVLPRWAEWKLPVSLSIAFAVLYAGVVSLFLSFQSSLMDDRLAESREQMVELLAIEKQFSRLKQQRDTFVQFESSYPGLSQVLNELVFAAELDFSLKNVQLTGQQVSLRAFASSASQIFSELSTKPHIQDLKFTSSIKKEKEGGESFALSFYYRPEVIFE